jgi:methionine synthase I (cobalamin-dependent)
MRGLDFTRDDPSLWNQTHPAEVLALHGRDVSAGAGAVFTNTFGANRFWLARFGQAAAVEPINRRAVELARQAAGPDRFVIGDLGPTAALQPGAALEQATVLLDSGVDALVLETYRFGPAEVVLREVREALDSSIPLLVSLWEWPDPLGPPAQRLRDRGASVLGMNCQPGIAAAIAFAQAIAGEVACPLLIKPSASGAAHPDSNPESFARAVPRLLETNVRLLGGCCGTTEAHLAALAAACARANPGSPACPDPIGAQR